MTFFDEYMNTEEGKDLAAKYLGQTPNEFVSCLLCGSENSYLWYAMGLFKILICSECGCRYVSPRFDDVQLDAHYSEMLFTQSRDYEGVYHNMIAESERARKRRDMKEEIEATLLYCRNGKVLDIGCQTGIYLEALPDSIQKYGIERSEWAANYTRKLLKAEIFKGKVEDASYPDEFFDVINMSYIVEHLQYPVDTMRMVAGWLKNGGRLIVSVPNFNSLCARIFKEFYRLADPRQHIFLTTPSSLYYLMKKINIKVVKRCFPYFGTPYCNIRQQVRLIVNAVCLKTRYAGFGNRGKSTAIADLISPAFYGNIITMIGEKKEG